MRLSHALACAIGTVVLAAFQTAADPPGTAANAAVNVTGDNRPDQWRTDGKTTTGGTGRHKTAGWSITTKTAGSIPKRLAAIRQAVTVHMSRTSCCAR